MSENKPVKLDIQAAAFAEELVSPEYRQALESAFQASPEGYNVQRTEAEGLVFDGIRTYTDKSERAWNVRRNAALAELNGTDLGAFSDYIHAAGGEALPADLTVEDLTAGKRDIVRINSIINEINTEQADPKDFLAEALIVIQEGRGRGAGNVGPENYATALKYCADKFNVLPRDQQENVDMQELVNESLAGFMDVTRKDKPNFVEMTNVYYAIRSLPAGTVDQKFTDGLLRHSLEQMPDYNARTLSILLGAVAKLDLHGNGVAAANLVDLTLRKGKKFETTRDMRQALQAIGNLPQSPATNRAFSTFFEVRNNLEQPLDLRGIDDLNGRLARIVDTNIDGPELTRTAQELAYKCAQRATILLEQKKRMGAPAAELEQDRRLVGRIIHNFKSI